GSGAGIARVTARVVDFGASGAPLSPYQLRVCNGCVQIPWALTATAISYDVPGVPDLLRLSGSVVAGIFLGQIARWDDPQIKKLNLRSTCRASTWFRSIAESERRHLRLYGVPVKGQ